MGPMPPLIELQTAIQGLHQFIVLDTDVFSVQCLYRCSTSVTPGHLIIKSPWVTQSTNSEKRMSLLVKLRDQAVHLVAILCDTFINPIREQSEAQPVNPDNQTFTQPRKRKRRSRRSARLAGKRAKYEAGL